jgi:hypothetical protein
MNYLSFHRRMCLLAGLLITVAMPRPAAADEMPALTPSEIVQKALERAKSSDERVTSHDYVYNRHTLNETLDDQGRLKERKEKLFEVELQSGLSHQKLVELNGQPIPAEELKKQAERELAARQKQPADAKPPKVWSDTESLLTSDLVAKYNMTLVDRKLFNGRDTYVLAFQPKSNLPVRKFNDRVLNHVAGTIWIDAAEFEVARVQARLQSEVTLWGGMIGVVRTGSYTVERTRMPDGAWFDKFSRGVFEGRKLLEPMLIRTRCEFSNFRPATPVVQ